MRGWAFSSMLAVLVTPSVAEAISTLGEMLAGKAEATWTSVFADLGLAVTMIAVALIVLALRGRAPRSFIWLLDRRALERPLSRPDRP